MTRPLVCHVNLASGFRGGERQTELLIHALRDAGVGQCLVARRGGKLAARLYGVKGVEVRGVASNAMAAAVAARDADLVHAHEARAVYAGWLLSMGNRTPYLVTRRVDNPFGRSSLRDRAYARAARVVGVSRAIAALVDERYGRGTCVVVPDAHSALSTTLASPADVPGRYAGKTVIGHIGALDHGHKGQGTIIDVARLAATRQPGWHFVLVGDGRDEHALRRAAEGLENVEFTGYVDNVGDWLAVFDVFVFPSQHEGLGSILLDAMHFGLPIVASRVGGIPDIIENGRNGILIEPANAELWYETIARLLADGETMAAMRRANADQAAGYAPERMAEAYLAIYSEISAAGRPA